MLDVIIFVDLPNEDSDTDTSSLSPSFHENESSRVRVKYKTQTHGQSVEHLREEFYFGKTLSLWNILFIAERNVCISNIYDGINQILFSTSTLFPDESWPLWLSEQYNSCSEMMSKCNKPYKDQNYSLD